MWGVKGILFHWTLITVVSHVYGSSLRLGSANLTRDQTNAVTELRKLVEDKLTEKFMSDDYFLVQWLAKKNFNVEETAQLLLQYIHFRTENNLANIRNEDWSDLRAKFPHTLTTDRRGRPVAYIDMGQWDVAGFLAEGPSSYNRYVRYIFMLDEEAEALVRQLRAEGSDISTYDNIYNLAGMSLAKHGCLQCMQVFRDISSAISPFFPSAKETVYFLNTPHMFKTMYSVFGPQFKSITRVYGQDRSKWEPVIRELVDLEHLPKSLFAAIPQKDNSEGQMFWN